jgi:hypothetical protein
MAEPKPAKGSFLPGLEAKDAHSNVATFKYIFNDQRQTELGNAWRAPAS